MILLVSASWNSRCEVAVGCVVSSQEEDWATIGFPLKNIKKEERKTALYEN